MCVPSLDFFFQPFFAIIALMFLSLRIFLKNYLPHYFFPVFQSGSECLLSCLSSVLFKDKEAWLKLEFATGTIRIWNWTPHGFSQCMFQQTRLGIGARGDLFFFFFAYGGIPSLWSLLALHP